MYGCLEWLRDEFRRNPGSVLIVWRVLFSSPDKTSQKLTQELLFSLLLIEHTVYSGRQNAFSSEISMQYEMDSGNAFNENQLGEEESETERDTRGAFSVPFRSLQDFLSIIFFHRSEEILDKHVEHCNSKTYKSPLESENWTTTRGTALRLRRWT